MGKKAAKVELHREKMTLNRVQTQTLSSIDEIEKSDFPSADCKRTRVFFYLLHLNASHRLVANTANFLLEPRDFSFSIASRRLVRL